MSNKIYRVVNSIDKFSYRKELQEWDIIKETPAMYKLSILDKYGEKVEKSLSKSKVGEIEDRGYVNSITFITFAIWCFEPNIEKCKDTCHQKVVNTISIFQDRITNLNNIINNK